MKDLILNFDDENDSGFLIKFGKAQYLKDIQNGKLRFTALEYYRNFKAMNDSETNAIADENEGVSCIFHRSEHTSFSLQHPLLGSNPVNITPAVESFKDFPNYQKYIASFSYFTKQDVIQQSIFSDKILENPEWDSVLFIIDSAGFVKKLQATCANCNFRYGKVIYSDYEEQVLNADEFNKSKKYSYQKEFRFSLEYKDENSNFFEDFPFPTVQFEKIASIIIPT
ncbi:MAG: hypothetical protein HDR53_06390 [Treponema sp.]|nr:hypothetical protein [Treponema sp.]